MAETIVVNSLTEVTVDGVPFGAVTDISDNLPERKVEILAAAHLWLAGLLQNEKAIYDDDLARIEGEHVRALVAKDVIIAERDTEINGLRAEVAALGGSALGQQMIREARRKRAEEMKAESQRILAELDGTPP